MYEDEVELYYGGQHCIGARWNCITVAKIVWDKVEFFYYGQKCMGAR